MHDLVIDRAIKAFTRTAGVEQPGKAESAVESHDGKAYAVLRNGRGVPAVYSYRDNALRRLESWPESIQ